MTTNLGFLARLLAHPTVAAGQVDTHFIDRHLATLLGGDVVSAAAAAAAGVACSEAPRAAKSSPWSGRKTVFDRRYLDPEAPLGRLIFFHSDGPIEVRLCSVTDGVLAVLIKERVHDVTAEFDGKWWHGLVDGTPWSALAALDLLELMVGGDRVALTRTSAAAQTASDTGDAAVAPMPGVVVVISVGVGDRVAKGAVVAVVEAMKMENQILAPFAGVVSEVRCSKQETVIANQVLVIIERDEVG